MRGATHIKIVAVMAFRNEKAYLINALRHLVANDILFALLDNGSDDGARAICTDAEFASHLLGLDELPYYGTFDLHQQLEAKMALISRLDADWVIHLDADEIMHSCRPGESLRQAIQRIDGEGYNAIEFHEFVFLPIEDPYVLNAAGPQPSRSYYFFMPYYPRLMRAWKKTPDISMVSHGGHILSGRGIKLCPEPLALRHYIVRDQAHAYAKYTERRFAASDIARGWHHNRIEQPVSQFLFPPADRLCWLERADSRIFDTSQPKKEHYWQW